MARGMWEGLLGSYGDLRQMKQQDIQNNRETRRLEREDRRQEIWMAQQQRVQDEYDRLAKERKANFFAATHPDLVKQYMASGGDIPLGPVASEDDIIMQKILGADPNLIYKVGTAVDPEVKFARDVALKKAGREPRQPRYKLDTIMQNGVPTRVKINIDTDEITPIGEAKPTGQQQLVMGPDGNPLFYSGPVGAEIPGGLGKRASEKVQGKSVDNATFMSDLSSGLPVIDLKYFTVQDRIDNAITRGKDYLGLASPEDKQYLMARQNALGQLTSIGNAKIRQLGGTAISAEEEKRLLRELPNKDDNSADVVGKFAAVMDKASRHAAIYKAYLTSHKGQSASPEEVEAWGKKYFNNDDALSVFGYIPITPQWVASQTKNYDPKAWEVKGTAPATNPLEPRKTGSNGGVSAADLITIYGKPE